MRDVIMCSDPSNAVIRLMDTAHRLGFGVAWMQVGRQAENSVVPTFVPDDDKAERITPSARRGGVNLDLTEEAVDV